MRNRGVDSSFETRNCSVPFIFALLPGTCISIVSLCHDINGVLNQHFHFFYYRIKDTKSVMLFDYLNHR